MDAVLQQILDLVAKAPLTPTGKEDIRHTIRTEYAPPLSDYEIPQPHIKYTPPEEIECDTCPLSHRHGRDHRIISCIDCGCMFTPHDRPEIVRRVTL